MLICFIALVTGLVTVAGLVGYHWFSVGQFLGLLELQLHRVSIPDCFLLNYSQPCETIFNEPQLALTCTLPDLQSVGRRFAVGVLGARANPRTPTSRADGERGAFNI